MLATSFASILSAGSSSGPKRPTPPLPRAWRWALLLLCVGSLAAQQAPVRFHRFPELAAEADAARAANRLDRAARLYQQALVLRPEWAQGWWYLGTVEYDQNAYAQAAHAFQRLITLRPGAGTGHAMLGLCQFELGDDRGALQHIQEGLHLGIADDPQMKRVLLYHQGVLLRRLGRIEEAQDAFSTLCADHVENQDLDRELGLVELRLSGKTPAIPPQGEQVIARLGQAGCLAAQSNFTEARRAFADLASQSPRFPHIHDAYGRFLLQMHDPEAAVKEFKQEIQVAPREVFARLEIAAATYRVNSAAGLPYAEQAVQLDPRQPLGHYFLGLLLVDTGHFQRAIPELQRARQALPDDARIYFALGAAYAHLGKQREAAQAREVFLRLKRTAAATASGSNVYGQQPDATQRLANAMNARTPESAANPTDPTRHE